MPLIGNALRCFAERDRWILRMEFRIHKAPTDGGVDQLAIAALKCAFGLQGDKRCAAHALHTAGNHDFGVTNSNGVRGGGKRL